jgi:hypothetical protein
MGDQADRQAVTAVAAKAIIDSRPPGQ